ncbi:MAG: helix-turn-helix domain-containing protein [Microbacteriaceae bacterium]|nr:helix-turn-helix domain-containing protein [Microbacteriaceae bacterium]MCL2794222.1 helix-turn-helix domain-containing protein [Microbacteriaceae bacterium]
MKPVSNEDQPTFDELARVRAEAIEHTRQARELSRQRFALVEQLLKAGYNQSDIARELGVTRQSIQKMMAAV